MGNNRVIIGGGGYGPGRGGHLQPQVLIEDAVRNALSIVLDHYKSRRLQENYNPTGDELREIIADALQQVCQNTTESKVNIMGLSTDSVKGIIEKWENDTWEVWM